MVNTKKTSPTQLRNHPKKNSLKHYKRSSFHGKHFRTYHYKYYNGKGRPNTDKYHYRKPESNKTPESVIPVEGTEEYMANKIKQTSAIIMRHLLSPNEPMTLVVASEQLDQNITSSEIVKDKEAQVNKDAEKQNEKSDTIKKSSDCDVKEIHERIMNHIVNLNKGRRNNFINANSTGLDTAIQEIQTQKRLELSRVLRQMCNSEECDSKESGELIDSIIPDIGIRLEELPISVIEQLRATLSFDFDEAAFPVNNDSSAMLTPSESNSEGQVEVKVEPERIETESVEITESDILDSNKSTQEEVLINQIEYNTVNNSSSSNYSQETVCYPGNTIPENNSGLRLNRHLFELPVHKDASCQTDIEPNQELSYIPEEGLVNYIKKYTSEHKCDVTNLKDVSEKMNFINKCINKLSILRDGLFKSYCQENEATNSNTDTEGKSGEGQSENYIWQTSEDKRVIKKRKTNYVHTNSETNVRIKEECIELDNILTLPVVKDKVSVIQRVKQELVIGTEAGKVSCISLDTATFTHTFNITSVPITSLFFDKGYNDFIYMYVGSYDMVLKCYDFHNKTMIKACRIDDKISCMDGMWGYIFLGCLQGSLLRYSIQKRKIDFNEKYSGSCIMSIKTAWEGARKVLIIGCKQAPISMRCAMTGLCLRNFSNEAISPTVYSLVLDNSHLYCGTASNNILVFSFHDGKQVNKISGADYNGISCMKIFRDLLFAGCYTGRVCVYNLNTKQHVAALKGPGGGILSMEVLKNQIIVGTLTKEFTSIPIPYEILSLFSTI